MTTEPSVCPLLSPTRLIRDTPVANLLLANHQHRVTAGTELTIHPHAWLEPEDLAEFLTSGKSTLVETANTALAWHGTAPDAGSVFTAKASFIIRHPLDFLRANEQYVSSLTENIIEGEVHPSAVIEGMIHLGEGTRILPGVYIEGNVVIGAGCKIGPNCYVRGNTSIGDGCHIGQSVEIKNCMILAKSSIGHLSYVGDSVLGTGVNFGAGTTTSNFRHDGKNHRTAVDGVLIDTGRRKFGAIIGDGVHTGIHTSIYPGRQLWPGTTTLPGEIVRKDILPQ